MKSTWVQAKATKNLVNLLYGVPRSFPLPRWPGCAVLFRRLIPMNNKPACHIRIPRPEIREIQEDTGYVEIGPPKYFSDRLEYGLQKNHTLKEAEEI